jgi:hypothetical protein
MSVLNKLMIAILVVASFLSGSVNDLLSTTSKPAPTEDSKGDGGATAL